MNRSQMQSLQNQALHLRRMALHEMKDLLEAVGEATESCLQ
jgi:hypothetical protein